MKITYLIFFFCIATIKLYGQDSDTLMLKGIYQGKNIILVNPTTESGFCIESLYLKGGIFVENTSAFEINLFAYYQLGDTIEIRVIYKTGCLPFCPNCSVILPASTYVIRDIHVDTNGFLQWTSVEESGMQIYIIQQYKWNKWVDVGEVREKSAGQNTYCFSPFLVSGENRFRVTQVDSKGVVRTSDNAVFYHDIEEVILLERKIINSIVFSRETSYELYNINGNLIKTGRGVTIDCANLEKGTYYLNYDNSTKEIKKRKTKPNRK